MASSLKVVFVGDTSVGKTAIYQRLESNTFNENIMTTVGGGFAQILIEKSENLSEAKKTPPDLANQNKDCFIAGIWDTAGQERFLNIVPMYFQHSDVIIIVYAINNPESFNDVEKWYKVIQQNAPQDVRLILVGNKLDLIDNNSVPLSDGMEKAESLNAAFLQMSAKTGDGISILKDEIREGYIYKYEKSKKDSKNYASHSLAENEKKSCC